MVALTDIVSTSLLNMAGGTHGTGMLAGGFAPWFGFPIMLLLVGLLVYAVYRVAQSPTQPSAQTKTDTALSLLRQRYASGEIDEEEFRNRKAQLEA